MSAWILRIRLPHNNQNLGSLVHGICYEPFMAVENPLIAVFFDPQFNIGSVARGDLRLCHGVGRPDVACKQWVKPLALLGLGRVVHENFHVSRIRRIAIEDLWAPNHPSHQLGQWRVIEKR